MFRHVVLVQWKEGTPTTLGDEVAAALRKLPERGIPFRSYDVGADLGLPGPNHYDFGVIATFDDQTGWDAYMADEEHDRIRAELINPNVEVRATVQFQA
jgi:hypothetical protein